MAAATGQNIPNVEDNHRHIRLANLTKLINVELILLMESFLEAKRRMDPMIAQINQARNKFNHILQQAAAGGETMMERELRDMKQTTSKLKSKIPFNLIAAEYQPSADPNIIFQPRTHPHTPTSSIPPVVLVDKPEGLDYFSDRLNNDPDTLESMILRCFLAFPEGAFIKATMLYRYDEVVLSPFTFLGRVVSMVSEFVSHGFIKSVYKKHSRTTLDGFWMHPFVHRTLKDRLSKEVQLECLVNSSSSNGEDIIYSGSADASTWPSELRFLHLGKWQRSPAHHNIEMPDPNLYFKYAGDMQKLMYISFRGVSVMKELPSFITQQWAPNGYKQTKLKYLRFLDLKACHHLEFIPSNIGNLQHSLTHLDMSECYFLDHMPASLSQLYYLVVLKGFVVGETNNEESCTLGDLSSMKYLVKLNIYTSLKTFPNDDHLTILEGLNALRNLTICWGGCPSEKKTLSQAHINHKPSSIMNFSFKLEKLDVRGAPEKGTPNWLRPSNFKELEKLYIRGGKLSDLRHIKEAQKDNQIAPAEEKRWSVNILRLRHLSKLHMDWSEVQDSFPNVVSVEKVECPNFTSFPCDDDGVWTKDTTQPPADGS